MSYDLSTLVYFKINYIYHVDEITVHVYRPNQWFTFGGLTTKGASPVALATKQYPHSTLSVSGVFFA